MHVYYKDIFGLVKVKDNKTLFNLTRLTTTCTLNTSNIHFICPCWMKYTVPLYDRASRAPRARHGNIETLVAT
jgi:hypothetical protein